MCNSGCLNSFCSVCLFWCCLLGSNRKWWVFSFYPCLKIQKWYFWRKGLLCSLSRVTVHVTLWWILTKICILVEEVQLQLIQGKIFMVAAFTLHLFLPGKNERNKFLTNIYWENADTFSIRNYSDSSHNFKTLLS